MPTPLVGGMGAGASVRADRLRRPGGLTEAAGYKSQGRRGGGGDSGSGRRVGRRAGLTSDPIVGGVRLLSGGAGGPGGMLHLGPRAMVSVQ